MKKEMKERIDDVVCCILGGLLGVLGVITYLEWICQQ